MATNDLLLDLDELIEPAGQFVLGGKTYAYKPWNGFGLLAQKRLQRDWQRVLEIEAKDAGSMGDADEGEHDGLVRALIVTISTMRDDEAEQQPVHKLGLAAMGFFMMRSRDMATGTNRLVNTILGIPTSATETTAEEPTGETSSPDATTTGRKRTRKSG